MDLRITLILQKGRLLLILLCKRVLKARDKLPIYGRTINSSFLLTVSVTGVFKKKFIQKIFNAIVNQFDGKRIFY